MNQYFTIGMAGHIDHGKTTLTKALTGIDTDRLKEEKERAISIEPGYAPFINEANLEVSIIDVPGHENFIRQMIAGVAGIDMVVMVIAADEGIMPQTKEHLDILTLLGMEQGCVVLTKCDETEKELIDIVTEEIQETMQGTFLEDKPIYKVDSLSKKGIPALIEALKHDLSHLNKSPSSLPFRMPIDQVFTAKGQGVIVRGTVYDGQVEQGAHVKLLPADKEVRIRQMERHHKSITIAQKGQRTAINLGGITHGEITRGDVLVANHFFTVTDRIDIAFSPLNDIQHPIKQRQPIKLHVGTAEVMGKIIFFDRNIIESHEIGKVLCQLQLDNPIVVTRGDRLIIRRPTPVETVGGGWIIDSNADKHRFGNHTIIQLQQIKEGSVKDRVESLLSREHALTVSEIMKQAAISEEVFAELDTLLVQIDKQFYTLPSIIERVQEKIVMVLKDFHREYPMRQGMDKAALTSSLSDYQAPLITHALDTLTKQATIEVNQQHISLADHAPSLPSAWRKRLEEAEQDLMTQGLEVEKWETLFTRHGVPKEIAHEFYYYLLQTERAHILDADRLIFKEAIEHARQQLFEFTDGKDFNLQQVRESLQLTRKNLIPLLELFDQLGYTERSENGRRWRRE